MPHHPSSNSGPTATAAASAAVAPAAPLPELGTSPSSDSTGTAVVMGTTASAQATSPGSLSTTTTTYSPPRIDGGAAAAIMRKPNVAGGSSSPSYFHHHQQHQHTVVTPVVGTNNKPWVGIGGAVIHHPHAHAQTYHFAHTAAAGTAYHHYHPHAHALHLMQQQYQQYQYQQHQQQHHVLPTGKSTDSTDAKSTATHASHASSSAPTLMSASCENSPKPPKTVKNTSAVSRSDAAADAAATPSMDERDGAANALLGLLTSAAGAGGSVSSSTNKSAGLRTSSPPIPFKKRLIMEKDAAAAAAAAVSSARSEDQQDAPRSTSGACHISPVSHSSSRTECKDTPPRYDNDAFNKTGADATTTTANRSESYDSTAKDSTYTTSSPSIFNAAVHGHQQQRILALLAESKVHNASQIALNARQLANNEAPGAAHQSTAAMASISSPPRMLPHFPTVLHQVLGEPQLTTGPNAVLKWLPDGESFQITNWTSLRRQVLPKYFGELRDEHGSASSAGTIDAFLYHLGAWGFEEVKDNSISGASGAYRHDLFIRGAQKLCVRMRFSADQIDGGHKGPKTVSPTRPSALQVPTLAPSHDNDTTATECSAPIQPNKRPRYESVAPPVGTVVHWPYGSSTMHRHVLHPQHFNSPEHLYGVRAGASPASAATHVAQYGAATPGASSYPSELQFRRYSMDGITSGQPAKPSTVQAGSARQYSPPHVRSARGGLRLAANRAAATGAPPSAAALSVIRQNFPVSNRGKGPRKPAAVRNIVAHTKSVESTDGNKTSCSVESPKTAAPINTTTLSEAQRIGQGVVDAVARKTSVGKKRKLPMASKALSEKEMVEEEKKED